MRTRGWQGDLPRDEAEARERIVAATRRCVERHGAAKTTLADVANELGVTRQTVYRYFSSIADLLVAVGESGAEQFLDRLTAHVADIREPGEALVEAIAHTIEHIAEEPHIGLLLQTGETELFSRRATSSTAMDFGLAVLHRFPIEWSYDEIEMTGLVEFMLRTFLSLLEHPSDPPRDGEELRAYLRRWVAPALLAPATS
ncbi:TetR/AcrR family transcriptional regulator [Nocardioides acrostichi]|uniref:TetR/AcrR family transcriptional regulator n=1 Tax=Nocardioides acrostichi TaxID=2784339 RepID=A0A930V2A0_9ACTN|nr:TetR/AcrR family transcriptional regulator [Nocardioides acrostichi]MBF4162467.1 TetR/AcrR family transcriptional regulator [Nocardioides acrostichi]